MKLSSFEAIVEALHRKGVRYLVAGGLAVVAHGYLRLTKDVDLLVQLTAENVAAAFAALAELGYRPRQPVDAAGFADPAQRRRWIEEKAMVVLAFFSDRYRDTPVDVLVTEPLSFDEEYEQALVKELSPGLPVRFLRREPLIRLKREAARPQDLTDIDQLNLLAEGAE